MGVGWTGHLFPQRTPTLRTRRANATISPHVRNQWYKSQRRSCALQSCGSEAGLHFAIRLLMGTGPTSENTTAKTWMPNAIAASRQADWFRCSKGNSNRRVSRVEPDIQNGITCPNRAANDERTGMCTSSGCPLSVGWANAATFSSLPHIKPSTSTASR